MFVCVSFFVCFLFSGSKNIIVNNFKHVILMQLCYMQKQNYVSFSDFTDFTVLWGNSVYYVQHICSWPSLVLHWSEKLAQNPQTSACFFKLSFPFSLVPAFVLYTCDLT